MPRSVTDAEIGLAGPGFQLKYPTVPRHHPGQFIDHRRCHRVERVGPVQRQNLDVFPKLHGDGRVFSHALSHHFVVDVCPVAPSSISFQLDPSNRAMRKD